MTQLRIASVNIERSKHLKRVEKFLRAEQPDVLCLQELCERDVPFMEDILGNKVHFERMCEHPDAGGYMGIGLAAWGALEDVTAHHYGDAVESSSGAPLKEITLFGTYQGFRIGTTHLRVTKQGESTPDQRDTARKLIALARSEAQRAGGLLLCGDFNAPRGRATFSLLADAFTDGVPAHYTTSIDGTLHRAGQLPFMVDGLFHTPTYRLEEARLHTGISDHCALTCNLLKA